MEDFWEYHRIEDFEEYEEPDEERQELMDWQDSIIAELRAYRNDI